MASSYALPSTYQNGIVVDHSHAHGHQHSHERAGSHSHGHRPTAQTHDRKEVLHGTGVALQHANHTHEVHEPPQMPPQVLREVRTAALLVLPFLTAALLQRSSPALHQHDGESLAHLKEDILRSTITPSPLFRSASALIEAMVLVSATLLLAGLITMFLPGLATKEASAPDYTRSALLQRIHRPGLAAVSLALSLFAALLLGGWRVAFAWLIWHAGLVRLESQPVRKTLTSRLQQHWLLCTLAVVAGLDALILASTIGTSTACAGCTALVVGVGLLQPHTMSAGANSKQHSQTQGSTKSSLLTLQRDSAAVLTIGLSISLLTIFLSMFTSIVPSLSIGPIIVRTSAIGLTVLAVFFARPSQVQSLEIAGVTTGALLCLAGVLLSSQQSSLWKLVGAIELSSLTVAVLSRNNINKSLGMVGGDTGTNTTRPHDLAGDARFSAFTLFLLKHCETDSLMYSILMEKDSRRIAYFTCLNFAFMLVQGLYGYLSGSLGLLSDTVHMFFDCLGLIVGLGAAVASKWPPSPERPFGWGKLNTLAGFGNGIFLMLVSIEFAWEAIEGILDGRELRRVKELLVVSTLGLLINLIGLFAFGHAHAGHDHSHGHGHSHGHTHGHGHSHGHTHDHSHGHDHAHDHSHGHDHDHAQHHHNNHDAHQHNSHQYNHPHGGLDTHDHDHAHNENMHGIFLHVAADAGGSLAVIISTALTLAQPWYLWDPLATIIIAVLIFAAAVPLVQSSGRKLLLIVPDDKEHGIKGFLQEVTEVRGALGYAAPRFWLSEGTEAQDHKDCGHDHDHSHEQQAGLVGSLHVIAAPLADLDDIRDRVQDLALSKGIRATVQVEYESDSQCWCGGSQRS